MQNKFDKWVLSILPKRNPKLVVAYCFNIAETKTQYSIELIGSREYDATNEDWACRESWASRPQMFKFAKKEHGDWEAALALSKELVSSFLDNHQTLLNGATAVAVGFVDGNLLTVSTSTS